MVGDINVEGTVEVAVGILAPILMIMVAVTGNSTLAHPLIFGTGRRGLLLWDARFTG